MTISTALISVLGFASLNADPTSAFLPVHYSSQPKSFSQVQPLFYSKNEGDLDAFDANLLKERIAKLKLDIIEEEIRRPPGADFTPQRLIEEVLNGLLNPYDPLPDSGFRLLMRTATKEWRSAILHSVGATENSDFELVASALGAAMGRPHNQFAILVGEGENYILEFPSDPLDFDDGTCWVECRLRDKETGKLLIITGWNLCQRDDGAWMVDRIDWQDFRDEFRPGIGREEWMRVVS